MTTALDRKLVAAAIALIDEFGTDATWTQVVGTDTSADVVAGTARNSTPIEATVKISPPAPLNTGMMAGDVKVGANTVIYAYPSTFINPDDSSQFEPEEGAKIELNDGLVYTATRVSPIYSGDDLAAYQITVRR